MQAASGGRGKRRLGHPRVGGDPRHDLGEVGALGEDRRTLDDITTGGVRTRQPLQQNANRIIVLCTHAQENSVTEYTGRLTRAEAPVPRSAVCTTNASSRP